MRAGAGRIQPTLAAILATCFAIVTACGGPSTPTGSPPPGATAGSGSQGPSSQGPGPTPAASSLLPSSASLAEMNSLEAADVRAMREELGIAAAIGADGEAVLDAIEAEEQRFGAEVFAELPAVLGIQPGATAGSRVELAKFGGQQTALASLEVGDLRQQVSSYIAMGTLVLPQSDRTQTLPFERKNVASAKVGSSVVDQTTSVRLDIKTGSGVLSMDIALDMSTKTTQAGVLKALVNGTGNGAVKINSCPDENGQVTGTVEFKLSELSSSDGRTGTTDQTAKATFTISVNGSARMQSVVIETTTAGGGLDGSGGSWTAGGKSSLGKGEAATSTSSGATEAQVKRVTSSATYALWTVAGIASQAEEFWRSGKCVDINSSAESKKVKPKEEVKFTVGPRGAFDKKPIRAAVEAKFTGKESLDPMGAGLPPPVSFTYKAGDKKDDKGTISLTQTSLRGIGRKSITFTVGDTDYRVGNYQGALYVYSGTKCKGLAGAWTLQLKVGSGSGTVTFTIPESLGKTSTKLNFKLSVAGTSNTYKLTGSVTPETNAEGTTFLVLKLGSGTITQKSKNGTSTLQYTDPTTDRIALEQGTFCGS